MTSRDAPSKYFRMQVTAANQSDFCSQYSCPGRSSSVNVILHVAAAAVSLLTICGNLLVIISISHFKQLHTPANVLILSLAVSDLLSGVFVIPFHLTLLIESCWTFGPVMCSLFHCVSFQTTSVSVHTVTLIAVDRFLALRFPFFYSDKISPAVICLTTLSNWLFSLFYNFSLLYVNGNFTDFTCPGKCVYVIDGVSSVVDLLVVFLIPCSLIIILYIQVFIIAKKHVTAIRSLQLHSSSESCKSERKAAMLLGILVFVFLLCLLPYYICSLVIPYSDVDMLYLRDVAAIFFFLNSTINPVIYALFYPWFKRSLKLIFTWQMFQRSASVDVILHVAAAAVCLLTVCGNLLVIISISHFKQLQTPANVLILSLAVSDLLVGVAATSVSVHTVALIALDRFLALRFPFFYSGKISPTISPASQQLGILQIREKSCDAAGDSGLCVSPLSVAVLHLFSCDSKQ
ncbi:hypothetical protein DNTS_005158 [Danionella cerebrum]|uniref:G-protein coupled receptors family 1 profile domain-containing protein n=1 Tax=Danionella cerebrum TaxID=2873325 RepID=A0A553QEX8_9TELE|nr:hypothetical protein DNTS_005158 [Danionella translucida]